MASRHMSHARHLPFAVLALAAASIALTNLSALAQEIVVKNDSLPDVFPPTGVSVGFQIYFNTNEEANVWLTAPCTGTIVAIDILWMASGGSAPITLENAITLYQPSTFPAHSNTPLNNQFPTPTTPCELIGPAMQSGNGMYEFRFLDENNSVPLSVPVTAGQTFVLSFEFGEDHANEGPPWGGVPTIPIDLDGCHAGRNGIFGIPGGYLNWCQFGSGDFVMRVKMVCGAVTGACCLPNGTCQEGVTQGTCTSLQGTFQGPNSTCAGANCQPMGACCVGGNCSQMTQAQCSAASGQFQGVGVPCRGNTCTTGACCVNGNCSIMTQAACTTAGGTYLGNNTTCNANSCLGACCVPATQQCANVTQPTCAAFNGTFQGIGTNCSTFVCFPMGACCLENGTCNAGPMSPAQCQALGGTFAGNNSTCATANCQPPVGACCAGSNCAGVVTQATCAALGGTWAYPATACGAFVCPYCPADINHSGGVTVDDLLNVITHWGPCINCAADIAPPPFGNNQVNVDDLLFVITHWGPCL